MDWYDWYELAINYDTELAVRYNWRRGRWPESQLPTGVYSMGPYDEDAGEELGSASNKVRVMGVYDADKGEMLYWKETYLD